MCGIWGYIENNKNTSVDFVALYKDFMSMKARGPDMSVFQTMKNVTVGFHRLAIMDPTFHANQPYIIEDGERTIVFLCNGEIYNFKELIQEFGLPIYNNSDCMVLPRLYLKYVKYNTDGRNHMHDFVQLFKNKIKGEFAFILFEFDKLQNLKEVIGGRDMFGVRPLYVGFKDNSIMFSSEIKGMNSFKGDVGEFRPGNITQFHYSAFGTLEGTHDYNFRTSYDVIPYVVRPSDNVSELESHYLKLVRDSVVNSVKRRLTADRPIAFLLSGGLDSTLTASVAARLLDQPINTYCCGLIGTDSTDIRYARLAAKHIKSHHTEVMFTIEEALNMIETVVKTIESYCITSVRASVPQYLVSQHVGMKTDAKVIITGEGSDEVASGYLYNYYAPSTAALHSGAMEYVERVHMYDGRRVDRCVSNASCEARIPLLDPEFVSAYWSTPAEWRMPTYKNCEKWVLRKAFDGTNVVQRDVLWRKKEAFSDGISGTSKSWYQIIQEHIETIVSDEEFTNNKWSCKTKEEYYYKKLFVKHFGEQRLNIIPGHWQPKWNSKGEEIKQYVDPSARTLDVYKKEDQENKQ